MPIFIGLIAVAFLSIVSGSLASFSVIECYAQMSTSARNVSIQNFPKFQCFIENKSSC